MKFKTPIFLTVLFSIFTVITSAIAADDKYDKPQGMKALSWLQQLEVERDKAELSRQLHVFENLSREISATLAGKYGFAKRTATLEERQIMLSSILKTREHFSGKLDIINDFYFHYDQESCWRRTETDQIFALHMGVITAADAIHQGKTSTEQTESTAKKLVAAISETNWKHLIDEVKEISSDQRLQKLEDQRDLKDFRNFTEFKNLTNQISILLSSFKTIPNGKILHRWIDSIIRTRHKFSGQRCLGNHGMINRYVQSLTDLEHADYRNQIATIMAVDAMAKLAISDEDFLTLWSMQPSNAQVSEEFIENVLRTVTAEQFGWPKEIITSLTDAIRATLTTRPDIVRLSGDIFNLYAPKLDLEAVYNEVIPSGGIYRDWTAHRVDTFSHVINLTDEENAANPGLETDLRNEFIESIDTSDYALYSTSVRGILSSEFSEDSTPLSTVKYIFDVCLDARNFGVVGKGHVHFYLTRNVNPDLRHLLNRKNALMDDAYINKLYRPITDTYYSIEILYSCHKGIPKPIYLYARDFLNGTNDVKQDLPRAIEMLRESFNLGYEPAKQPLAIVLYMCANDFARGTNGIQKCLTKAIELWRESDKLGYESAKTNLAKALNNHATSFINGTNGIERNLPKAIELLRESAALDFKLSKKNLAIALNKYSVQFINGTNGVSADLPRAIEMLRESVDLGCESAKENLGIALRNHSIDLTFGCKRKDLPVAIKLLREAVKLGYEPAKQTLAGDLNNYAFEFIDRGNNPLKAIELIRECLAIKESIGLDCESSKWSLAVALNNHALDAMNGTNDVEKNLLKADEFLKESNALGGLYGYEPARRTLSFVKAMMSSIT